MSTAFTAKATDAVTGLSGALASSFTVQTTQAPVAPLIGARGGDGDDLSFFTSANTAIGPLNCTKLFYSDVLPSTFVGETESDLPAGVVPVVCYKTETTNVASYVNSVTCPLWLVYHQEPEGDYTLGSTFVSEFENQSALIRAQGNPNVKVVMVAAGYPYRNAGTSDVLDGNYIPPLSATDYYCKDVYQDQSSGLYPSNGLANYPEWTNWLDLVQDIGGIPGITEYGIGMTNGAPARNTRLQLDCAYLRANLTNLAMWQYWWVTLAGAPPATQWQFTDAPTIATWQAIEAGTL